MYKKIEGSACVLREPCDLLRSSQGEADTKLLVIAKHAADSGAAVVIISSPYTDIAIIACCFAKEIDARLLFETGPCTAIISPT